MLKSQALGGESEQRETTGPQISANERLNSEPSFQLRVAVVDAINWQNVNLFTRLSISTSVRIESNDEIRLIFDVYDLPMCLKTAT